MLTINKRIPVPTTTCPNCMMVWLAPGLKDGDTYECRRCKFGFVVGSGDETASRPLAEVPAETRAV